MSHPPTRRTHSRNGAHWQGGLSLLSAATAVLLATSITARADISVRFIESAPKDRFVIENVGACAEGALEIEIDLATAPVGLIFDTTASGAGVEVFQPFEVAAGGDVLAEAILPTDGDASVQLSLTGLAPGGSFAFTVDVDDTGERSDLGQIRVSDAEIAGASVSINGETALFGGDAVALLPSACIS